jgi:excisionase family DNA binding protein
LALSSGLRTSLLGFKEVHLQGIASRLNTGNTSPNTVQIGQQQSKGVTMSNRIPDAEVLLTPKEVAQRFHVNPKTVTRWAKAGKLTAIRTLGGHRRYRESEVLERLREYKESTS